MTLDTENTAPQTDVSAPPPEAKTEAPADVFKEDLNDAEKMEAAEDAALRDAFRKSQAAREEDKEPDEPKKAAPVKDPKTGKFVSPLKEEVNTEDDKPLSGKEKPNTAKTDPKAADKDADQKPAAETKDEAKKPAVEAPKHWSEKQKAALSKLAPDEQEEFIKEATEARQHLSRQGNALKTYEPIGRMLTEHKQSFDRYGLNYEQGLKLLLETNAALDDPNTVQDAYYKLGAKLSQMHGFDVGRMQSQAEPEDQDWVDPNVLQLRQELEETRRVARESQETLQRMLYQQREESLTGFVNQFFEGKEIDDALGEEVSRRVVMLRTVYPDASNDQLLARAYEEARLLNPATQEKIIAEKLKEEAAKVEQARRAAALAVQSEPDPYSAASEDEMLRRAYRKRSAA